MDLLLPRLTGGRYNSGMRFRIHSILWVFALVAAAMSSFGVGVGLAAAVAILVVKVFVHAVGYWSVILLALAAVVVTSLLPAVNNGPPSPRNTCTHNIVVLAKTLLYYKSEGGVLSPTIGPPPRHSWRVAILPYLDHGGLYAAYDFNAAWNAPTNQTVAKAPLSLFNCPISLSESPGTHTNYFAVNGPDTIWGQDAAGSELGVSDRLEDTILLIEAPGSHIAWSEPVDFDFEEAVAYLTGEPYPAKSTAQSQKKRVWTATRNVGYSEINVAFADGGVRRLSLPLRRELAVALLTANGGEQVDHEELYRSPPPTPAFGRILSITTLGLLSLIPLKVLVQLPEQPGIGA